MFSALGELRVIELGCSLATAHVGQLFADFGATVISVEPTDGSPLRRTAAYPFLARGKHSVVADLDEPEALERVVELCRDADIVVDANERSVSAAAELSYEAIRRNNPRVIRCTISSFGDDGPYPWMPADEAVVMAKIGGYSAFAGLVDRAGPAYTAVPFCSFSASQTALHGILAAVIDRERTGHGQRVATSLTHGIAAHDVWNWYLRIITQRYPDAYVPAPHVADGVPNSALVFRLLVALSSDSEWLQFSQTSRHLYVALMQELGMGWMFDDPDWSEIPLVPEPQRRVELWDRMLHAVRERSTDEWSAVFDRERDVWAERFRDGRSVLEHPQLVHDGTAVEIDDPSRGAVRQPGPIARLDRTPALLDASAPVLGDVDGWPRQADGVATAGDQRPDTGSSAGDLDATDAPLAGIVVVEFAMFYAAPYAATLLADLGARVIKVEPIGGDPLRGLASFPEVGAIKPMQGKESIELDLASDHGRRIAERLIARADIVIQSFRAGAAERLGVDAASARRINPDVVYLNAPGYGVDGPCGGRPAYAPTIAAASGLAWRLVEPTMPADVSSFDVEATKLAAVRMIAATNTSFAQCDGLAALASTTAALLGLAARQRGAGAQTITTSMLLSAAHANCEDVVDYRDRPATASPGASMTGFSALQRMYETADGWLLLSCPDDAALAVLTSELPVDPDDLERSLISLFAQAPAVSWEERLTGGGIAAVAVSDGPVEAVLLGEQSSDFDHLHTLVEHPMLGEHERLAPLVSFSRSQLQLSGAESLGASTDAVLHELGYSSDDIVAMRAAGAIG